LTDEERSAALSREILTTAVKFMPKLPRQLRRMPKRCRLKAGFVWLRSKCSHRIYARGRTQGGGSFHSNATLYPKVVKQVLDAIE
jgi:hypothetical protein